MLQLRFIFFFICFGWLTSTAQKTTVTFAQRPGEAALQMDIYQPATKSGTAHGCVLFAFGGGFFTGARDAQLYLPYFQHLNNLGFAVASIDYRLGLKGLKKPPSLFNRKPLINAIAMAVADLYTATDYLIQHAQELKIDSGKIVLSGSSAGAISALQADYEKRNGKISASLLPPSFQYAGVIAFAGAIYSTSGRPTYAVAPAPLLFFHGSKDDFVPYNKIGLFGTGMYGPKSITKKMKDRHQPYTFYSMEGIKHDVASFPMREFLPEIQTFIKDYIEDKKQLYIDVNIKDDNRKNSNLRFQDAYRNRN